MTVRQVFPTAQCVFCNQDFVRTSSAKKCCSTVCAKKLWAKNNGEKYWIARYQSDPEKYRAASRASNKRAKDACYAWYGGYTCSCCGVTEPRFLTLDHVDNDGAEHRRVLQGNRAGAALYRWIIKNEFPPKFQVLCYNCNCGKNVNGGVCPHKDVKNACN